MSDSPIEPNDHVRPRRQPSRVSRRYHPYSGGSMTSMVTEQVNNSPESFRQRTEAINQLTPPRVSLEPDLELRGPPGQHISLCPYIPPIMHPSPATRVCGVMGTCPRMAPFPSQTVRHSLCRCPYPCLDARIYPHVVPPIRRPENFFAHQSPFSSPHPPPRPQNFPSNITPNHPRSISTSARMMPLTARRNIFPPGLRQVRPRPNITSARGTRTFPFQPTSGEDGDSIQSITASRVYRNKSFEELRLEEYSIGNKGKKKDAEEVLSESTKEEIKSGKQNNEHRCIVCLENKKSVLLLPCSHMCVCSDCSENTSLLKCPICRSSIEGRLLVYW